ncbi:L-glyceraldehyde 3-phosphate reductase [Enterobacter cloacae complex sp. P3B]|uniref:L-glyceraldehyde 3-phosphate reductase n=1 Tax=unclassified Enterobacter cloacae complex TaxID=2757714 RepID=UPI001867CA44|nr:MULTISPECIES: L-glyceraldehyde 3-phosphate reductase [unclassified Enterobacter cloacae complex]MBE3177878.1 L-glyceraldehyde 3-phosphate reductase [Enterobacter cloacae complex sp. P26RS]MBE3433732.1 L-glyceraldehyde 3-phosphate reductase [Enterobacter cloacae complex sp. P21RS]MBE3460483.1 L-glyceraldehyde 3-phosphate reductase [Enterobacter cloacae complex sp. P21C]MBE3500604.1 L-glyceraldehyde 3-phosphate reductase [Enterobacter cloacae complex sp. P2B]MBE3505282.1 L-glyceraldehyde 3-ph
MGYQPDKNRYQTMEYRRCGRSGIRLPAVSLGLWHNFGDATLIENSRQLLQRAFDLGITHFDLANNYGPPPGSAERNFGRILQEDFLPWRDELIVSTKAGYTMWDGPYGDWGSRKYLLASLDQSLKRMGLEYVDIFYHHRPDPETPLQETMKALDHLVRQGKTLYVGLSNYPAELARKAIDILNDLGTPCLIHQPKYSMFERAPEEGLLDVLQEKGVGCIPFSPLAGGQLTNRYLNGIPADSRAASGSQFLNPEQITEEKLEKVRQLNALAESRGQKLSQMALAWVLRHEEVTSVLIGASKTAQIDDAVGMLENRQFTAEELSLIDQILSSSK